MSTGSPPQDGPAHGAHARAVGADARVDTRLRHAIDDLFMPEEARLSDRTRAAVHAVVAGIVAATEAEVRRHAARLLAGRGGTSQAEALLRGEPVLDRLSRAGLLRDPELMEELIARVELDLLARSLPTAVIEPDRPSLLIRLAEAPDGVVATAALALLATENRRRAAHEGSGPVRSELPAELHQRLTWYVAAAVREQSPDMAGMADRDRALTEASLRSLAAHDESDRPEAAAARLAAALDPQPDELGPLLTEAVADRRLTLFVAVLARSAGVDYEQVRHLAVDPSGDLLLLLMHAVGLDRVGIARIGVALTEADPRRDLEQLADAIDWAVAHDRDAARVALAPLALADDFRAAVRALARSRR
ncbi:DUF2336 domain-containing protein [Sphingomonas lenta]|uniref:DUF2336 domain-containing protein n=1 Tax=Sphingomonas lenta TaxID=1141887 RepID=A0A2A2SJX3_9SPHN|nr:DUF2336 domain-containing protein [Sphingomonas lenta]PAX09331.1 hypothetical protein CKY28_00800 [Sphingomonas lenta]